MCSLEMMRKRYECDEKECAYATNKMSNRNRHKKRHSYPAHGQSSSTVSANISDGDWKRSDPGQLSDIVGVTLAPKAIVTLTLRDQLQRKRLNQRRAPR